MKQKSAELDALIEQYRGLVEGLAADRQEMALLLTVGGHAKGFAAAVTACADAVAAMLGQLQVLARGIDTLSLLDDGSGVPDFFAGQLSAAVDHWAAIGGECGQQLELARSLT